MGRLKTTVMLDENLMREIRVRAARLGRSQSEVLEMALREGLGAVEEIRAKTGLSEDEALKLASEVVHEIRAKRSRKG